jgi:thioredoxin 1
MPEKEIMNRLSSARGRGVNAAILMAWLCLFAFLNVATAAKTSFHVGLEAAYEAAAAEHSLVLLVFSAEWCGPCKMLKKQTLDSQEFQEKAGPLHVTDIDIDEDQKTAAAFSVSSIPHMVLLSPERKVVAHRIGFIATAELLKWIDEGRERAAKGQWEGTAPGSEVQALVKKAEDGLDAAYLAKLIEMLDRPDPADRAAVSKLILAQRETSVPLLIQAVTNTYLGIRIAACDLLKKLSPDSPAVDPWQSPTELQETILALQKWWAETGKLSSASETATAVDPSIKGSVDGAIKALVGDDPVKRTEAMASLVNQGSTALPSVHDAIKRHDRAGNHRAVSLLEEVRWAILIPDSLEQQAGGVRNALARGTGPERQAAVTRLARAGREAITPLAELSNDTDALVVEVAVRELSKVGGKGAIPAMAALLKAADSNLRMTAAQALGHTKNPDATKHLLTVLDDPNEVVAVTAISALEEVYGVDRYSSSKKTLPDEVTEGLRTCLSDSRWRVRAATAEIIGKTKASNLADNVKKLLKDLDDFVVKSALAALQELSAAPDAEELAELGKRLPGLRAETVKMMLESETPETAKIVASIYDTSSLEDQIRIVQTLAEHSTLSDSERDDPWKALLTKATTATDPRLRRAAAEALSNRSPKLAAELIGPLLADDDAATRAAAAESVLVIVNADAGSSRMRIRGHYISGLSDFGSGSKPKTNAPLATAQRISEWHSTLALGMRGAPDPIVATALFITGDGKRDLPVLSASISNPDKKVIRRLADCSAIGLIVPRIKLPEGREIVDRICAVPEFFGQAVLASDRADAEIKNYLLEPARFRSAVERASKDELQNVLQLLVDRSSSKKGWSLWVESDQVRAILPVLLQSTNAAWRAAAVFISAHRNPSKNLAPFEAAAKDSNAWVRAAAIQGFAQASTDRATLDARLAPMLNDSDEHVARIAAVGLLEAEVRKAANLEWVFQGFQFENMHVYSSITITSEERPLEPLEAKPAFLGAVRKRLAAAKPESTGVFALLLAQYGDFSGLDEMTKLKSANGAANEDGQNDSLMTAIALSHDAKYVPFLRGLMTSKNEWELRKLLQALKGMNGAEARQLRLDINKQIRSGNGSTAID